MFCALLGLDTRCVYRTIGPLVINDDPGLALTYFTGRSNWVTYTFE